MQDDLPFKVVRTNSHDEIIARDNNLLVGRAAYETARRMYPQDRIDYRCGARVIERSDEPSGKYCRRRSQSDRQTVSMHLQRRSTWPLSFPVRST